MSKAQLAIALITLSVATVVWAVPEKGTAHQRVQRWEQQSTAYVAPIRLHDEPEHGLVATAWLNGAGPFRFAVDTGAGVSLITRNVVQKAHLQVSKSRRTLVGGLSTAPIASNQQATLGGLALGTPSNRITTKAVAAVVTTLPGSIDGVLDPTDTFSPLGYSVDLPQRQLRVFDANSEGLRLTQAPRDGAVVPWVRLAGNGRPFVRLSDGRLALIDTGSGFGLALTDGRVAGGRRRSGEGGSRNDLGGGRVQAHEIAPQRVSIGALVLNGVPSDVLSGVAPNTPNILGRRALFPFKITFDPIARLISFEPSER